MQHSLIRYLRLIVPALWRQLSQLCRFSLSLVTFHGSQTHASVGATPSVAGLLVHLFQGEPVSLGCDPRMNRVLSMVLTELLLTDVGCRNAAHHGVCGDQETS